MRLKADDPDGLLFRVVSSSILMAWQRSVEALDVGPPLLEHAELEHPAPPNYQRGAPSEDRRRGGRGLDARMTHPERPLAEHYGPLTMGSTLVSSQGKLDAVVDRAFGALRTCRSELGRHQVLFARYTEMTGWGHATLATAGIVEGHGYSHANGNG